MNLSNNELLQLYLQKQENKRIRLLNESLFTIQHNKRYYMPYIKELLNKANTKNKKEKLLKIFIPKTKKPKIYELNSLGKESKCELCNKNNSYYFLAFNKKQTNVKLCKDCCKKLLTK